MFNPTRLLVVHTFMPTICTLTRLLSLIITITTDFIVIIIIVASAATAIGTRSLKYLSQGQLHREATTVLKKQIRTHIGRY